MAVAPAAAPIQSLSNEKKVEEEARLKREKQEKKVKKRKLIDGQIEESKKQLLVAEEQLSALKKELNLTATSPLPTPSPEYVAKSIGANEVQTPKPPSNNQNKVHADLPKIPTPQLAAAKATPKPPESQAATSTKSPSSTRSSAASDSPYNQPNASTQAVQETAKKDKGKETYLYLVQ